MRSLLRRLGFLYAVVTACSLRRLWEVEKG
jgi:hypothetical protein